MGLLSMLGMESLLWGCLFLARETAHFYRTDVETICNSFMFADTVTGMRSSIFLNGSNIRYPRRYALHP